MVRVGHQTAMNDQEIKIGDAVEMVTRKIKDDGNQRGIIVYGYKFRLAFARSMAAAINPKTTH